MIAPWLTLSNFIAASGWSRGYVFRLQKHGKLITRKDGRTRWYSSESLPAEAIARLTAAAAPTAPAPASKTSLDRPRSKALAVTPLALPPAAQEPPPLLAAMGVQGSRRVALTGEALAFAEDRHKKIQPIQDYRDDETFRARCLALRLADSTQVRSLDHFVQYLAEFHSSNEEPLSKSTLYGWDKRYREFGIIGLARKIRQDKGVSRWATRFPEAAKLVAATYLQPFATRQRAYDALVRDAVRLGMREDDIPSYDSVCDFLSSLPAAPVVFAREGEPAYSERFATYLRRDYYDIKPYQIVVSDHMIHDCEVWNDCFFGIPEGAPMRLRLTMLMDLRSRKALMYTWTPEGSSRSISTALRDLVRKYGAPQTFYCDNGKDYQKIGKGAEPVNAGHFKRPDPVTLEAMVNEDMNAIEHAGVLRQLGVSVQYCIKYHPQSKPIERMFRTLHLGLDAILPHYTTGSTATRPEAANVAGAQHRKLLRMGAHHNSPLLPASHFIGMAKVWIEEEYNAKRRVKGRGMDGLTPNEVFEAGYPLTARRDVDASILDQLLWQREKRQVSNGAVKIANRRLIGVTSYDQQRLELAEKNHDGGADVLVCFDPNEPTTGIVTDLSGHKICDVRAERFAPHSAEANPMIAEHIEGRTGRRNNIAASIRAVQKSVVRSGHVTDAADLYQRAIEAEHLLPMAVGDHITQRVMTSRPVQQTQAPASSYDIATEILEEIL